MLALFDDGKHDETENDDVVFVVIVIVVDGWAFKKGRKQGRTYIGGGISSSASRLCRDGAVLGAWWWRGT